MYCSMTYERGNQTFHCSNIARVPCLLCPPGTGICKTCAEMCDECGKLFCPKHLDDHKDLEHADKPKAMQAR